MEMWVHILNLPFGWMETKRGACAAGLIGNVVKVDTGPDGTASGPFLRARVAVDVQKPLRRGVLLKSSKNSPPEWFDIQFEKLPFYCHSCGLLGHMDLDCPTPAPRNALGKLPYDVKLRAPDEKKKKPQSFGAAAAEAFGSSTGSGRRTTTTRCSSGRQSAPDRVVPGAHNPSCQDAGEAVHATESPQEKERKDAQDNVPVVKTPAQARANSVTESPRKRKTNEDGTQPVLSVPMQEKNLVPTGLVHDRLHQLGNLGQASEKKEVQKKQRVSTNLSARSAAAASSSPRRAQ
jgi:hypothetical protein